MDSKRDFFIKLHMRLPLIGLILFVIILLCWGYIPFIYQHIKCDSACGEDPVLKCYSNRVICVGSDNTYIKEIK